MKSTELRIGNYLNLDKPVEDKLIIVSPYHISAIFTAEKIKKSHIYLPIPLNEEWLLKCGFAKCKGRHGDYFKHIENELFRVWRNDYEADCWGVGRKDVDSKDREYNTHWIVLNVKYVHQLQNLYFALVGEELQIHNLNR